MRRRDFIKTGLLLLSFPNVLGLSSVTKSVQVVAPRSAGTIVFNNYRAKKWAEQLLREAKENSYFNELSLLLAKEKQCQMVLLR